MRRLGVVGAASLILVPYLVLATLALAIGIAVNSAMGGLPAALRGPAFQSPGLYMLIALYALLHFPAWLVVVALTELLSVRTRSIVFLVISSIGFGVSLLVFNPTSLGGLHLWTMCWLSWTLMSVYYLATANRSAAPT